jgi:hypothetical protein
MRPIGLKLLQQPLRFVHWSHFLSVIRHAYDEKDPADVTRRTGSSSSEAKFWAQVSGFSKDT